MKQVQFDYQTRQGRGNRQERLQARLPLSNDAILSSYSFRDMRVVSVTFLCFIAGVKVKYTDFPFGSFQKHFDFQKHDNICFFYFRTNNFVLY